MTPTAGWRDGFTQAVDGELDTETTDVRDRWRDGLVAFVIGCSFTFERALADAGVPVRHVARIPAAAPSAEPTRRHP